MRLETDIGVGNCGLFNMTPVNYVFFMITRTTNRQIETEEGLSIFHYAEMILIVEQIIVLNEEHSSENALIYMIRWGGGVFYS